MAVAKTYETMEQIGQPFEENGKMYVRVKGLCPRCGGSGHYSFNQIDGTRCYGCGGSGRKVLSVRWYTESQRASMDRAAEKRAEASKVKAETRRVKFAARNAFGFGEAGYITIYKGDQEQLGQFFKSFSIDEMGHHAAWHNLIFGWFTPSFITFDRELPEGVEAIRLDWDTVRDPEDEESLAMQDSDYVTEYVRKLTAVPSKSQYQGEVGKWITKEVTIKRQLHFEGRWGTSNMHIMEDADQNVYVWTTGSQSLDEGETYTIKMKVKEHKEYNGINQTVVWYCRVQEEA